MNEGGGLLLHSGHQGGKGVPSECISPSKISQKKFMYNPAEPKPLKLLTKFEKFGIMHLQQERASECE